MIKILFTSLLFTALTFGHAIADDINLSISKARIIIMPPMMKITSAYMTLKNNSDKSITLVKATSDSYEYIDMHKTQITDGMAKMIHQETLTIAAGESLAFENGSYHLMMHNPTHPLVKDELIKITFHSAEGQKITFDAIATNL